MGACHNQQIALNGSFGEGGALGLQWGTTFPAWFQTIPPERVGLNGEYDYYGLQKRVEHLFRQHFSRTELAQLRVGQRGRVVVLQGRVASREMLQCLVDLASKVEGSIRVETTGMAFGPEVYHLLAV